MGRNTTASVMEVEMTAKNISSDPSLARFICRHPGFYFLKNIFRDNNSIIHHQARWLITMANKVSTLIVKPKIYIMKNARSAKPEYRSTDVKQLSSRGKIDK